MNTPITLQPLIATHKHKAYPYPSPLHIQTHIPDDQPCPLVALIAIGKQHLPLIGQVQLQQQQQQLNVIVYYSTNTVRLGSTSYRVVYIPPSKVQQQVYGCMGDVLRQLADVVVSDINSGGVHKLKQKQQINSKHYVLSAEKDIYQVAIKESSFQLVRTMQLPLLHHLPTQQPSIKVTDAVELMQIISKYASEWQWLLCQKTWPILPYFALQHYRCMSHLKKCDNYNLMSKQSKMLSNTQIQAIDRQLVQMKSSSGNSVVFGSVIDRIMRDIRQHNQQLVFSNLSSAISTLELTIACRDNSIRQYKHIIQKQQEQLNQYHQLDSIKRQLQQSLQTQTLRNQQLTLQLTSTHLLQRKSLQAKVELQSKIMQLKHEKDGLLQCLQELTQQNLSLLSHKEQLQSTIQQLQSTIQQLKESLQQTSQIQVRALRSVQNEAQIRTRLYRYQKYVSQLKLSIQSFKKLQSQKFNYILNKNYQQYQHLQNKYNQTLCALNKEQKHSRMLNQSLQRERIRLNYFEKLLTNNCQHQPIPQCSEENSQTDREVPALVVE